MLPGSRRRPRVRRSRRLPSPADRRAPLGVLGLLGGVLGVAAIVGLAPPAAATADTRGDIPGPVVLVGTGGVRWEDTSTATPALRGLAGDGAVAVLSARSVRGSTCPVDGWLAVSAGARAADEPGACRPPALAGDPTPGGPAAVARWDVDRRLAAASADGARPGLLGDALAEASTRGAAVGPGAAGALADSSGRVGAAWPGLAARPDGSVDPAADPAQLTRQVGEALATHPELVAVDVGSVRADAADPGSAAEQVRAVDARLAAVLAAVPRNATVLVVSLADAAGQARLQLAAARGPAPGGGSFRGYLRSASTRQDGLVQSTDVLPTITTSLGLPTPAGAVGSPMVSVGAPSSADTRLTRLADLAIPAETLDPIVAPFFAVLLVVQFLVYVGAVAVLARRRRQGRGSARLGAATAAVAVGFALVPAGTFVANLWPWWRSPVPASALAAAVVIATVPLALATLLGPWRRALTGPAGVAGALTALVLTADVATGSHLSLTALIGGQPLVGGRFYGLSNPGFALFATGALFAAIAAADPLLLAGRTRAGAVVVAAIGVLATLVDGLPGLGSDFGGPPALVPAFAYLTLRVAGVRLTWQRVLAVLAGTVAVLAVLAVGDWLRPPDQRTHLGRYVQTLLEGGG
ncbi:MAG: hypothetical protein ACXV1K_09305, partial [Kineosporiaceae bacterium]